MDNGLEIRRGETHGKTVVLRVVGRIDAKTAPRLLQGAMPFAGMGRNLVLNLADVTFMGSSGVGVLLARVVVLAYQRGRHLLLVDLQYDAAGLFYRLRVAVLEDRVAIVEDGDCAVGLAPGVVLEGKSGAGAHLEVTLLPTEAPDDLARVAVDLVDGGGFAGRDEQVAVVVNVQGVDVEIVDAGVVILFRSNVGLLQVDVI